MMDASKGHGDIVKCLHRVGAGTYIFNYLHLNINNKNDGQTAIMKVAAKEHDDIFHYLKGSSRHALSTDGINNEMDK